MKKIYPSLIMLLLCTFSAQAQWILGLNTSPSNPTTNENIQIIADVSFPSGDCQEKTLNLSSMGNTFMGSALHCVGILTFICNTTDTFNLGQLPEGTYTFKFELNMGQGPSPCTPGIAPGDQDSITFTVTTATGIHSVNDEAFAVFPNPGKDGFLVKVKGYIDPNVTITDLQGRSILKLNVSSEQRIDLAQLANGQYLVELRDGEKFIARKKWIKMND
jgi:hypothetical protein